MWINLWEYWTNVDKYIVRTEYREGKMEQIIDITNIKIEANLSKEERIQQFIKEIKDPYEFQVGEVKVRTSFADNSITMQDRMEQYFKLMLME